MIKTVKLLLVKILSAVLTYSANALITNLLSLKDTGYYFLFITIVTLFSAINKLGLDFSSVKTVSILHSKNDIAAIRTYNYDILAVIVFFGLILCLPLSIVTFFSVHSVSAVLLSGVALILLTMKDVIASILRGIQKYYEAGFIQNSSLPLVLVIIFGFSYWRHLPINPYIAYAACASFCFCTGIFFLHRNQAFSFKKSFSVQAAKKVINYNKYLISIFFMGITWLPNVLVSIFLDVESVALFNVVNRSAIIISFVYIAVENYIQPKIAAYHDRSEYSELQTLLVKMSKLSFVVSSIVVIGCIAFASLIMGFFGEIYASNSNLFVIMSVAQYLNVITGSAATFMMMTNREVVVRNVYLFTLIGICIIIPFVSYLLNIYYTVLAYAVCLIILNVVLAIIARVKYKTSVSFLIPIYLKPNI